MVKKIKTVDTNLNLWLVRTTKNICISEQHLVGVAPRDGLVDLVPTPLALLGLAHTLPVRVTIGCEVPLLLLHLPLQLLLLLEHLHVHLASPTLPLLELQVLVHRVPQD